jgi:hypothetical protein
LEGSTLWISLNMVLREWGKIPGSLAVPSIVYVFPEVVWPYMNMVPLYPLRTD